MSLKHFIKTQDLFGKNKERFVFFISLIMMIISSSISVFAANYLYDSAEVSYDNNISGISSDNVQGAIDELYADANDYSEINRRITALENNFLDKTYPIGSIYISVTDDTVAKVQAKFGGTWEAFGAGRTLVGVNTSETEFNTVSKTGGVKTINLSHSHTVNSHSHTMAHTHTMSHTHTMAHTHGLSEGNAFAEIVVSSGAGGAVLKNISGAGKISWTPNYVVKGSIVRFTTGQNYGIGVIGTTNGSSAANTGGSSAANTGGSSAANTGNASPGTNSQLSSTQSILQPYITVYMYKRTA